MASHVDKIRALETILAEQEALKQGMHCLHYMMESQVLTTQDDQPSQKPWSDEHDNSADDAQSEATVSVGGLERVDEEDEGSLGEESQLQLEGAEVQDHDEEVH